MFEPFAVVVVSQEKPAEALKFVPAHTPLRYHSTRVTPTLSVALTFTLTMPETVLAAAGAVSATAGAVTSGTTFCTETVTEAADPIFPAASYAVSVIQ